MPGHELAAVRREAGRPALGTADRMFSTAARFLPCANWASFNIQPATNPGIVDLVARCWTCRRRVGRQPISREVRDVIP